MALLSSLLTLLNMLVLLVVSMETFHTFSTDFPHITNHYMLFYLSDLLEDTVEILQQHFELRNCTASLSSSLVRLLLSSNNWKLISSIVIWKQSLKTFRNYTRKHQILWFIFLLALYQLQLFCIWDNCHYSPWLLGSHGTSSIELVVTSWPHQKIQANHGSIKSNQSAYSINFHIHSLSWIVPSQKMHQRNCLKDMFLNIGKQNFVLMLVTLSP